MLSSSGSITVKKAKLNYTYDVSDVEHFADIYIFKCHRLNDDNKVAIIKQPRKNSWKLLISDKDGKYQSLPYKVLEFKYTKNIVVVGDNND